MTNKHSRIQEGQVTVSIVSHGHCSMLNNLLMQINDLESPIAHVIITHNIPSNLMLDESSFSFQVTVIRNKFPSGFGRNHNQAFKYCATEYFCVLNPDVEFLKDPFYELIDCLKDKNIGIAAPIVFNSYGIIEDSHRKFPTPLLILKKVFFNEKGLYKLDSESRFTYPDWVAGMFMLARSSTYKILDGFDEKYFLYYEDIDFCLRSWRAKKSVVVSKNVSIIHNAQRDSHIKLKFFILHFKSMCRFFLKHWLRFPR
jgi:N-acetylglucosaminyl-diphospho-decaprenol L-rhamnosyltransferase